MTLTVTFCSTGYYGWPPIRLLCCEQEVTNKNGTLTTPYYVDIACSKAFAKPDSFRALRNVLLRKANQALREQKNRVLEKIETYRETPLSIILNTQNGKL